MKFLRRLIPNTLMKFGILLSFLGVIIVGLSTAPAWWRVAYSSTFPYFWTRIGWGFIVIGFLFNIWPHKRTKEMNKKQLSEFDKYKLNKKREVLFAMGTLSIITLIVILFIQHVIIKAVLLIIALLAAYGIGEWHIRQRNKRKQAIERRK